MINTGNSYPVFEKYAQKIESLNNLDNWRRDLSIDAGNGFQISYAPFDYVNTEAKVVFVGITPGEHQALNALNSLRKSLKSGATGIDALKAAKKCASFSGQMRNHLIKMLDHIGLPDLLEIKTSSELFEENSVTAHFTSILRYPVFYNGHNYSGAPSPLADGLLSASISAYFSKEVKLLPDALYFPLGPVPTKVLFDLSKKGFLEDSHIIDGLPHPSPANAERITYFVGDKIAGKCSVKTNPEKLDEDKARILRKLGLDIFLSSLVTKH